MELGVYLLVGCFTPGEGGGRLQGFGTALRPASCQGLRCELTDTGHPPRNHQPRISKLVSGWGAALAVLHLAGSFKSQHSRNPYWVLEYQNPR